MNFVLLEFEKHLAFLVFPGTGEGMNADRTKVLMLSVSQSCCTEMQPQIGSAVDTTFLLVSKGE